MNDGAYDFMAGLALNVGNQAEATVVILVRSIVQHIVNLPRLQLTHTTCCEEANRYERQRMAG